MSTKTYTSLRKQMAALRAEMREAGKTYLTDEAATLFTKYPDLDSFSWTQFTPYFNDGDACVFRMYGTEVDGDDDAADEVEDLIDSMEENDLLDMFGDHAEITITREGIEVSEYDHD